MFLFDKKRKKKAQQVAGLFKTKYAYFKALLDSNSELLTLVADMEVKLVGETAFGMSYLRSLVARIAFHAARMVKSINKMSNDRYTILGKIFEDLIIRINLLVEPEKSRRDAPLILFYGDITRSLADIVGGKNANLGEILHVSGMAIPRGFAITTAGYEAFVASNNLLPEIKKARLALDPDDFSSFVAVGSKIESLFRAGKIPVEVEAAIRDACQTVVSQCGKPVTWALRSSAIGEDGDLSFAGQYRTVLNVSSNNVLEGYKEVLAGLCTPSALSYRLNMGVPFEDFAMSVACLEMISARASGVVYSRNPIEPRDDRVIINGVWGLGLPVVDGKMSPDIFRLSRRSRHDPVETEITRKEVRLSIDSAGSLVESPVAGGAQTMPCLSTEQARALAAYALMLEEHFGCPQDVEWVVDEEGRIVLLQTRPLRVVDMSTGARTRLPLISGYPLLLQGGEIAFPGVGSGTVFQVKSDQDLTAFPDDAVLVAEHSSPKYGMVLRKAKAVVTNLGSNTGHMAALVREFKVPCLLNTGNAMQNLVSGQLVTVDSISRRVYQGEVKELGAFVPKKHGMMRDTPIYHTLRQLADIIIPLNLVDPASPEFTANSCKTIHDMMRFTHERSYHEMFSLSELAADQGQFAVRLRGHLPIDLYIVDLGSGLQEPRAAKSHATLDEVVSAPFKALLQGLLHPDLRKHEPDPVDLEGLFSVFHQQMFNPSEHSQDRFGGRSYAIISDKYLNFSSRVGYHYSIIDAYMGRTLNKNYIHFEFKGGAADETRRIRRVRMIEQILFGMGFSVEVTGDRVNARYQKYDAQATAERLEMLGKLLIYTRQKDMLMKSDSSAEIFARNFLEARYRP